MKILFLSVQTKGCPWVDEGMSSFIKKINQFYPTDVCLIKSPNLPRDQSEKKKNKEGEKLLGQIKPDDEVVLFDEFGKHFQDSHEFSKELVKIFERSKKKLVLVVGGPFGLDESVRLRANFVFSLSPLTMSHHVAQVTALEQVYRGLTIWKGLPYHND